MGSSFTMVDGEVIMSKVQFVIWFISLDPLKYPDMESLMVNYMKYLEDRTEYGKIDSLFDGILLG